MELISVKNLKYKYSSADTFAVDDVTFGIEKGSYTAIVGFNGSGKSTIARVISGLENATAGSVEFSESVKIGIVFQSPKNQIVSSIVKRDTAFGPQSQKLAASEVELRTIESLNIVDMLDKANSQTNALSLGQTQKIALSGIIAVRPDVLILDEAVSMLDPVSRKEIFDFVNYWHAKGNTIIQITHDMEVVQQAEKVIGIEDGKVFFNGSKELFLSFEDNVKRITGEPLPVKDKNLLQESIEKQIALSLKNVTFAYNEKSGVNNISFDLYKGTLTALTGPSGAGKSTILEIIAGLLKCNDEDGAGVYSNMRPILAQQNAAAALFEAYAADDVAFGPRNNGKSGKELKNIVKNAMNLSALPFEQFGERHTFELSGGEQRRLSIAGILAMDSDIVLFDEPTAGLDSKARTQVMNMLRKLADDGKTVLFTTHKMDEAAFSDREIKVFDGRIVADTCGLNSNITDLAGKVGLIKPYDNISLLASLKSSSFILSGKKNLVKKPVIQKLPPAVRILIFLAVFTVSLCAGPWWACCAVLLGSILYGFLSGFSFKSFLKSCLKILPFLLFFALLQLMFHPPVAGEVHYTEWKLLLITPSKIIFCICCFLRTFAALASIFAFFFSTPDYDLIDGLSVLLKPMALIKIPVRFFVLIMEVMFRFIPLLVEEAECIIKTQMMRGGLGKTKGKFARIKAIVPLVVPMIVQTIKKSEYLAEAIVVRGFK